MSSPLRTVFIFILLAAYGTIYAQEQGGKDGYAHTVWKKRVVRSIYIVQEGEPPIKDTGNWNAFFTSLVGLVMKGKVTVYKTSDLAGKMGANALKEQFATLNDTVKIFDPVTNEEKLKIISTDFDYATITQLKICEEWVFDPQTKKTNIRVAGVAPAQDIYNDANNYRKTDNLFWIKWEDFQKYANDYQDFDALYDLGMSTWKDYLKDGAIPDVADMELEKEAVWKTKMLRKTRLYSDTVLNYETNLTNEYDSSVTQILYNAARTGKINAYSDQEYEPGTKLNPNELKELTMLPPDTLLFECGSYQPYDPYCFECIMNYCVHERWKYSYSTGITEISYLDIAPMRDTWDENGKLIASNPLYWFNYTDASALLTLYNQYNHPSIEFQLWQDRFRQKKHEQIKTAK